jgi:hypothetical protein
MKIILTNQEILLAFGTLKQLDQDCRKKKIKFIIAKNINVLYEYVKIFQEKQKESEEDDKELLSIKNEIEVHEINYDDLPDEFTVNIAPVEMFIGGFGNA